MNRRRRRCLLGERKDIKDKLLHLDAVGFAGLDPTSTCVHKWNLLDCNMLLQLVLKLPVRLGRDRDQSSVHQWLSGAEAWTKDRFLPCYVLQKLPGKEVVADVSSTKDQGSPRSSQLSRLWLDLAVLDNLEGTLHFADHAQRFCGVGLLHHLTHSSRGWTSILVSTSGPGSAVVLL